MRRRHKVNTQELIDGSTITVKPFTTHIDSHLDTVDPNGLIQSETVQICQQVRSVEVAALLRYQVTKKHSLSHRQYEFLRLWQIAANPRMHPDRTVTDRPGRGLRGMAVYQWLLVQSPIRLWAMVFTKQADKVAALRLELESIFEAIEMQESVGVEVNW